MGEAPHGLLPRPLACADKRRDPEEGRVGAERGAFYKGTAPPLTWNKAVGGSEKSVTFEVFPAWEIVLLEVPPIFSVPPDP